MKVKIKQAIYNKYIFLQKQKLQQNWTKKRRYQSLQH